MPRVSLLILLLALAIGVAVLWYPHESEPTGVAPVGTVPALQPPELVELADGSAGPALSASTREPIEPALRSWRITPVHVVRDEDGTPIVGAEVTLTYPQGEDVVTVVKATDASGTAEFETAYLKDCTFRASADGRGTTSESFRGETTSLDRLLVREHRLRGPVKLRLSAFGEVFVRLVDDDGRDLRADSPGLDARVGSALSVRLVESSARFGEPAPAREALEQPAVREDDPTFPFRWRLQKRSDTQDKVIATLGATVLASQSIAPRTRAVAVTIRRDALAGLLEPLVVRVVGDADDAPMPGVAVTYSDGLGRNVLQRTDEEGRARFERMFVGSGTLTLESRGFVTDRHPANALVEGDLVLRMRVGRTISGVLLDEKGVPVPNRRMTVFAFEPGAPGKLGEPIAEVNTLRDGRFQFTDVEPGRFRVGVSTFAAQEVTADSNEWLFVDCRAENRTGLVLRKPESTPLKPLTNRK